jgi:hypothetical protein
LYAALPCYIVTLPISYYTLMLSNHEQRRKRIVDGAHVSAMNSIYKFNQEETSYDRVMRVLNSQQNRITNMLKKYG